MEVSEAEETQWKLTLPREGPGKVGTQYYW